jgi:hypothetical protein
MIEVQTRIEGRRGCGYRKPGGIYLVGPSEGQPCCKLPFELSVCPCCSAGIKPSRGWTWVDVDKLFFENPLIIPDVGEACDPLCPLSKPGIGRAGLLWVGEKFYPTTGDFTQEANLMGISRRISTVPRGFELGKTWVLLAHRKVVHKYPSPDSMVSDPEEMLPGIFHMFKTIAVEYVVKGNETQEDLEQLVKRGLTPVDVNPVKRRAYRNDPAV